MQRSTTWSGGLTNKNGATMGISWLESLWIDLEQYGKPMVIVWDTLLSSQHEIGHDESSTTMAITNGIPNIRLWSESPMATIVPRLMSCWCYDHHQSVSIIIYISTIDHSVHREDLNAFPRKIDYMSASCPYLWHFLRNHLQKRQLKQWEWGFHLANEKLHGRESVSEWWNPKN